MTALGKDGTNTGSSDGAGEIWLLVDSSGFGGIETHLLQVVQGLKFFQIKFRLLFWKFYREHPLFNTLKDKDIEFEVMSGSFWSFLWRLKKYCPSVLHTHGYKAGILGRIAARFCGTPVVSTHHAGDVGTGRIRFYNWLDQKTSFLAQRNIAVSRVIADRIGSVDSVIANFVMMTPPPLSLGDSVAFVGRLAYEKGPERFCSMRDSIPMSIRMCVFGDGAMRESLEIRYGSRVEFKGDVASMDPFWKEVGLLVITSREEGLPMVLLEALSRGIPVLSTAVGSIPEIIRNGKNGWVIEPFDADVFGRCVTDWFGSLDAQRKELREQAVQAVLNDYSTEAVLPVLLREYQLAMKK